MAEYPTKMTPALHEVLGMMIMQSTPIAHAMRAAGQDIPRKIESEQAHVLHWLIGIALEHGDGWRKVAGAQLEEITAAARAAQSS